MLLVNLLQNPYVLSEDPSGSSSGSAISVAANLVTVSLGTETDGSILSPSNANSVVGIKPTVGLTSRSGVVPISPRQDTIGYVWYRFSIHNEIGIGLTKIYLFVVIIGTGLFVEQ